MRIYARLLTLLLAGVVGMAAHAASRPKTPARPEPASQPASRPAVTWRPTTQPAASQPGGQATTRPRPTSRPDEALRPAISREELQRRMRLAGRMQQLVKLFGDQKYAEAKTLAEQLVEADPGEGTHWYNLACANSRLGNKHQALSQLAEAVERGFDNMQHMETDPDLQPLAGMEGFKKLLARRDEIHRRIGEQKLEALTKQFGEDYIVEIDHKNKLVFATNVDRPTLESLRDELTRQANALWSELFTNHFERYIAIIIPKPGSYQMPQNVGGFYNPAANVLVARSIGMVLRHEFTHALHFGDQYACGQQHPIWALEGLATLYETSRYEGDRLVPEDSDRLLIVQQLLNRKQLLPLEKLMKLEHGEFVRDPRTSYSMSRYFMMYLYRQGKLRDWYQAFKAGFEKDKTGIAAVEEVLGKPLPEVEKDWLVWVAKQKAPEMFIKEDQPYMGVNCVPAVDGLQVMYAVPGAGADKAGLKKGDIILRINGEKTIERADLVRQVMAGKVGDALKVAFRRDKEVREVEVVLTPKPRGIDQSIPPPTQPAKKAKTDAPTSRPAKKATTRPATAASRPK